MILNNCLSTNCWGSSRESVCTCKMKYRLQVYSVRENIHILHTYNDRRIQLTVVNEKKSLKHPTLFFRKKFFNGITKQKCIYMTTIQKASNWQCQFNQIQEINLFATPSKKILQKINFNNVHLLKHTMGYAWLEGSDPANPFQYTLNIHTLITITPINMWIGTSFVYYIPPPPP